MKKQRPETLPSTTIKVPTGHGGLYITITEHEGKPFEVFCTIGKSGGSTMVKAELTGRFVSYCLRNDLPLEEIVDQIIDLGGNEPVAWKNTIIKSIPDAVAKVLKARYLNKEK